MEENIVYRRVSTRYFMEKYRSGDILVFIARNWRFSRYIGDLAINRLFLAIYHVVNVGQTRYSARQRATVHRFGVHPLTTWAKLPFDT